MSEKRNGRVARPNEKKGNFCCLGHLDRRKAEEEGHSNPSMIKSKRTLFLSQKERVRLEMRSHHFNAGSMGDAAPAPEKPLPMAHWPSGQKRGGYQSGKGKGISSYPAVQSRGGFQRIPRKKKVQPIEKT